MTDTMLQAILDEVQAKSEHGERILTDGRRITLYVAHDGVGLTVAKVESVKVGGGLVRAKNDKGELYVLALEDLFAASIDSHGGASASGRKAGFVG
jgi:hypothetical protein